MKCYAGKIIRAESWQDIAINSNVLQASGVGINDDIAGIQWRETPWIYSCGVDVECKVGACQGMGGVGLIKGERKRENQSFGSEHMP